MLLKKLEFVNYKTYYGHQEVDLYIPEDERKENGKNIILLGGLNGAGKTTILKAILYILFGKRGMTETEYKRLFSNVINNTFFDEGGRECQVSLSLETDKGEEWNLKIKWYFNRDKTLSHEQRSLDVKSAGSKFKRTVQIDNIDVFNKFIDKIIPYHAAPFFIFDGEEIKDIILRQNSQEMKDAIHKITGMESYKQLLEDLNTLKQSIERQLARSVSHSSIKNAETELIALDDSIAKYEAKKEKIRIKLRSQQAAVDDAKNARNEKMSKNSKSRETIIKKQTKVATQLEMAKKDLNTYYSDNVLYIILGNKISKLKNRIKKEKEISQNRILQNASLNPYRNFMDKLLNQSINPPLSPVQLEQIKELGKEIWIKENDIRIDVSDDFEEIHDISNKDFSYLSSLPMKDKNQVTNYINNIERLTQEYNGLELEIRNAPEAVNLEVENDTIDRLTKIVGELDSKHRLINKKLRDLLDQRTALKNKFTRLNNQDSNTEELQERLQNVTNTIAAMKEYVTEVTKLKAEHIRDEFSSMLKVLFRKQDEFGKIEFDINTYSVRLFSDRMQEISIQERSAGEMQMISSALIWALTKVSDLSLPMVIDTPLGRLDSYHRNHLINHYYKNLSEQVIILSTDTEITSEYVNLMEQSSYKQYMLDYDERKKYTVIRDGYFDFVRV
ncbi:DNA sulfur modification protein DndD [Bacillus sp. AFS015802]|uniref:DNA sulfur modification protein DndD n=1 Tax=Bacillus sp. AFS015802 TaxID=2033486 RepID=UPI000BF75349|nr:DNA sulfur modification protein DndD [Bacillus sp. AFS015802]PFA62925.1 DNA sulfur modification protein DndD [Bacillus sp. AFS015802]